MQRRIKIGIDVGGTFTHAVAVNAANYEIIAKSYLPTTHTAAEGVARGVVEAMHKLLEEGKILAEEVALIAHSTTQATNALLEGDVARVGVIGMASGLESGRARRETDVGDIELAPGKFIHTVHRFLDSSALEEDKIRALTGELVAEGAEVIVASESFGVDNPENEERVVAAAAAMGLPASAASIISQLYGLRIRTRTAVINASMLPKMLETANRTEQSVRASGITAPLMVMRSDGGIMEIDEMRRRPILTMLSGPAAGVAAALMYARISDGIFVEVGGTSSDISAIRNGRPLVRSAIVGGHKLYLRTLDVRTVGIGGGSMPRIKQNRIADVGPRSAHIAGLRYPSFAEIPAGAVFAQNLVQPRPGDPEDYLRIEIEGEEAAYTLTPTEAANYLDLVPDVGYGRGNRPVIDRIFAWLSRVWEEEGQKIATRLLDLASAKVIVVVEQLIKEYRMERSLVQLVGGGGGATAIVPYAARTLQLPHQIAENCEVISAIGAALGIIRDSVERTIIQPTEEEILKLRSQAIASVQRMGASPDSIEVTIDIDRQSKRVTATATGASELRARDLGVLPLEPEALRKLAALSFKTEPEQVDPAGGTPLLSLFLHRQLTTRLWGIVRREKKALRVLDQEGIVRLQLADADFWQGTIGQTRAFIDEAMENLTIYGDAGALLPDLFILIGRRIIDMTGLAEKEQILALARIETEKYDRDEPIVVLAAGR
ncbi:MAG TPA: hydantoinase/oxoprolinase family protein [bacterium]|nr:hydantoinase/oxoprolinase family protein [bacterium]